MVFAVDGMDLDGEGVLVVVDVALGVMEDELLTGALLDGDDVGVKIDKLVGMGAAAKEVRGTWVAAP